MSKTRKVKITEVVLIERTRIVDIEFDEPLNYKSYDLDNGDEHILNHITRLVREQHSTEKDMTEMVIKAEIL